MPQNIFTTHPNSLGETYREHQRTAFSVSWALFTASLAAAIHGLFPCFFETTASRAIIRMHDRISSRLRQ